MVSCSRGSANHDKMVKKTGRFQVPFLLDPNTGIEMFESAEIEKYLEEVFTIYPPMSIRETSNFVVTHYNLLSQAQDIHST